MSSRIHQLSDFVANQIAAGEVVERPASLVKELIENSLDAGAARIEIETEQGGVKRVLVRDDGSGILEADLRLAVSRHATSKIVSADDLSGVASLGFRGEALASVASVARLSLISRPADAEQGFALEVDGGREVAFEPRAHPVGTTVEVADLFYNTPARRKFLKAERTEENHIDKVVRSLSLARMDVAFELRQGGGRSPLLLPAGAPAQRLGRVLSREFVDRSVVIDESGGQLKLTGWVGLPTIPAVRLISSTFTSMGDWCATSSLPTRSGRLIGTCSFTVDTRFLCCSWSCRRRPWMSTSIPPSTRCAFREARDVHDFIFGKLNRALRDVRPDSGQPPVLIPADAADSGEYVDTSTGEIRTSTGDRFHRRNPAAAAWHCSTHVLRCESGAGVCRGQRGRPVAARTCRCG